MGRNMVVWIEANIFVNEGTQNEVLLNLIKPLVQRLRSGFRIEAYHFLHEPNNEIRFRVLTNRTRVETIKGLIDNLQSREQVREVRYPETPYQGERHSFGEDGWKTTYKFLEAGSDFALDLIDPNARKGSHFNRIAFSHYFLNQTGFNQLQEASFHLKASIERMLTIMHQSYIRPINEKITQLEARIQALEEPQST